MATIPTPKAQGLQSATFIQPPLDGSLSLPALYDWQAVHSPHHPLFTFEDSPGVNRTILWSEAHQGIQRATRLIREKVGYVVDRHSSEDPPVVAVLASADTITFATFIVGALRAGCILFPLSLRNSLPAITALLQQTRVSHIFVSSDKSTRELAKAAMKNLGTSISVKMHTMPVFEELYPGNGFDKTSVSKPSVQVEMEKTALILHSSGTTAFPAPIYITHRLLVETSALICSGDTDLAGSIIACHSLPMFHGFGMIVVLFTASTGFVASVFKPQHPPAVPNPINTFEGAIASDYVMVAPTFLETWSQDRQMVEALAKIKGVMYGGGPLTKAAGDTLASHGVNIFVIYAITQTFVVSNFLQKPVGMDWEYFQISPARKVQFTDKGDNEFEPVVLATDWYRPCVINTRINGRDGFATSDLVSPHPTKPGFWKVVGRTDDQIMHSTGEKTNPGPLEGMLMRDPFVSGAVIFGRGRFQCGVLVQPNEPFKFNPSDTKKLAEFRSLIWPTIESINAFAPQHSRLFKEMILVASPSKPFTYTAKGSLRRQAIINEYAVEIDALYAAVDESSQEDIICPFDWSRTSTKAFVRLVVEKTVKKNDRVTSDDTDLFEVGLDSLQATWIRNSILRALRESQPSVARKLPLTFVYDNPTIARLAEFISLSVMGGHSAPNHDVEAKRSELFALVDKYTKNFPLFGGQERREDTGNVILLTGGTGSLGSNILAKLLEDPTVSRIYAMSRPSSSGLSAKERHVKAFEREGLDNALLNDAKVHFVEGNAERADFGIDRALYKEMQSEVTHVIHNAWRVNFNIAVSSFESNIRSVRNNVNFALGTILSKPPKILFVSSIGIFQNYSENRLAPEEHLLEPDSAIGMGYAESKWVSEQILRCASEKTPLSTTVIRCGQMTGGPSGAWNDHEWFPSLIKSSITLGRLLDVAGDVSWVTAYDAAGAIVDMLDATNDVLHLVAHRTAAWSSIIKAFSKVLRLPTVPLSEWLNALEQAHVALQNVSSDAALLEGMLRENPALRLMDFFRAAQKHVKNEFVEPLGVTKLGNEKAVEASKSLRDADSISTVNVERWVSYWRKTGFIH